MFCTMCGKENDNTSRFCIACGNKLSQLEPVLQEFIEEQPPVVVPEVSEPAQVEEVPPQVQEVPVQVDEAQNAPAKNADVEEVPAEIKDEPAADTEENNYSQQLIQPVEEIPDENEETQTEEVIIEEIAPVTEDIENIEPEATLEAQNIFPEIEPVTQAVPAQQEEIAPAKAIKKKGFMSYTGLVLCFILLFAFVVSTMAGIIAKISISPKQLEKDIDKIDVLDIQVGEMISTDEYDVKKDDTILDIVSKTIQKNSDLKVSEADIRKIYEDTEIRDYMAKKVSAYADYVTNKKDIDEITSKEIVGLIEQNKDKIEEIADIKISDDNLSNLESYLDDNASDLLESLQVKNIDNNLDKYNYSDYDFLFNNWMWICAFSGLGILIILFSFFVFKLNKNAGGSIVYLGSVAISSGALFLVAGIVLMLLKNTIADAFDEASGFASSLISIMSFRVILIGGIVFVAGMITVLIKKLASTVKNNKNKPAEAPQVA